MKRIIIITGKTGAGKSSLCKKLQEHFGFPLLTFANMGKEFANKNGYQRIRQCHLDMKLEDFIEGMACEGGCVAGPGSVQEERAFKKEREKQLQKADDRLVTDTVSEYSEYSFSMHRSKKTE